MGFSFKASALERDFQTLSIHLPWYLKMSRSAKKNHHPAVIMHTINFVKTKSVCIRKETNYCSVTQVGIWKSLVCVLMWAENILKRWRCEYFPDNSKLTSDCFVFNSSGVVWMEKIWCVFRVKPSFSNSSDVVWTENIWCVFRVKPPFSNSSDVVWTENIWCVFWVKPSFSNSSGVVWMENISCVFRVKPSLRSPRNNMGNNVSATCVLVYQDLDTGRFWQHVKEVPFQWKVCKRSTFSVKMVDERARGWTSGRSFRIKLCRVSPSRLVNNL